MITIRADDKKRIRIPSVKPHDVYHLETMTRDLIVLRRIEPPQPRKRKTAAEIGQALQNSRVKFSAGYDELRQFTRE